MTYSSVRTINKQKLLFYQPLNLNATFSLHASVFLTVRRNTWARFNASGLLRLHVDNQIKFANHNLNSTWNKRRKLRTFQLPENGTNCWEDNTKLSDGS